MTDMHGDVPGAGAADNASSAAPCAADGGSGGNTGATDFLAALSEDNRKAIEKRGLDSADALATAYNQATSKMGSMISVPGDSATDEDRAKFRKAIGVPDSADDYKLEGVEGLTDEQRKAFREYAHGMGYTEDQARQALSMQAERAKAAQEKRTKSTSDAVAQAEADLTDLWGASDGEKYKANMSATRQAIDNTDGLADELKRLGIYDVKSKKFTSSVIVRALSDLGAAKYVEGGSHSGGAGGGDNPFAKGSENITEQAKIMKEDPEKARRLIKAAGRDPDKFGQFNPYLGA